ncbi:hypothetical protein [Streptomyces milbemycinicus]|uniref:ArsR family transcriptional regulator n=1 Tax=Streptomyces milbemycinicus TaxID=476552 RepID=A0ABW8LGX3_9ACTN
MTTAVTSEEQRLRRELAAVYRARPDAQCVLLRLLDRVAPDYRD